MHINVKDLSVSFQVGAKMKKEGKTLEDVVAHLDVDSRIYADVVSGYQCTDQDLLKRLETEGCFVADIFEFCSPYSTKRLP